MKQQERNRLAIDKIKQWQGFTNKMSHHWSNRVAGYDDLQSEAALSVIKAIDLWDPARGTKLDTWIQRCIRQSILSTAFCNAHPTTITSGHLTRVRGNGHKYGDNSVLDRIESDALHYIHYIDLVDLIERYDKLDIAKMYFVENMKYKEIARILGISVPTISRHVMRVQSIIQTKWLKQ